MKNKLPRKLLAAREKELTFLGSPALIDVMWSVWPIFTAFIVQTMISFIVLVLIEFRSSGLIPPKGEDLLEYNLNSGADFGDEDKEDADVKSERKRVIDQKDKMYSVGGVAKDYDAVQAVNLWKKFAKKDPKDKDVVATKRFHLGVSRGECFGLLGPNGAGKVCSRLYFTNFVRQQSFV